MRKLHAFTLIELIVVMGILAILATIVVIAVNPGRQFAASRNAKRANDTRALANAIQQHAADSNGNIHSSITSTPKTIGTGAGNVDLMSLLVPNYISAIPKDPQTGTDADTKYSVYTDSNQRVIVSSVAPELNQTVDSTGQYTNYALQFDGTNDYAVTGTATNIPSGSTARTLEAWIRLTPTNTGGTFLGINTASGQKFYLQTNTAYIFTDGINSPNNLSQSSGNLVVDTWYHFAFTFDGSGGWRYFLNGTQLQSGTFATTINTGTPTSISIGQRLDTPNSPFRGIIDEVRISNVVRYTSTFTPQRRFAPDSNTMGLWHFDENTGTTAADSSGNNNTGTLTNGPVWIQGQ